VVDEQHAAWLVGARRCLGEMVKAPRMMRRGAGRPWRALGAVKRQYRGLARGPRDRRRLGRPAAHGWLEVLYARCPRFDQKQTARRRVRLLALLRVRPIPGGTHFLNCVPA